MLGIFANHNSGHANSSVMDYENGIIEEVQPYHGTRTFTFVIDEYLSLGIVIRIRQLFKAATLSYNKVGDVTVTIPLSYDDLVTYCQEFETYTVDYSY